MNDVDQPTQSPHVEAFDASYSTTGDYADASYGTTTGSNHAGGTYSGHPSDVEIVPARTAAEQAALEFERDERAKRAQAIWADQHERELAAAANRPKPEVDPHGDVVPTNEGAYRCEDWEQREAERHAIAQVDEPEERRHYTPGQTAYLGASIESLMGQKQSGSGGVVYLRPRAKPLAPGEQYIGRASTPFGGGSKGKSSVERVGPAQTFEEKSIQYG